jgi:predicted ATPase/DNA-binding CsgD family transcriptional regulator
MTEQLPVTTISPREAEVLTALGEHLTNAEIAGRLFISVRTVESHVSSLLRKLGVADRRALAAAGGRVRADAQTDAADPAGAVASANLPSPLTPFVGRAAERHALVEALGSHRLVTAVGPGGVGKTRLALSVAAAVTDRFADGVWYVDLVPVTDDALVARAVAAALGVGEQQGRTAEDTVVGWFADRRALLVLDNCEHLLDGVVGLLERLLAEAPGLTVLATSRARLLVPYERVLPVPGLSIGDDDEEGDAVALFLQRAASSGAVLTHEDRQRVAGICRGLDGMALAIELAAARLPAMGLDGLAAGLEDRLQLLSGGRRADDRHRSLRSTLDWSYALLDDADQAVLRRVSVFAAPFAAEAAKEVVGDWPPVVARDVQSVLARLADQSLLVAVPGGVTRYRSPETIRQYGGEQLEVSDEADEAAARHLAWCLSVAEGLFAHVDDLPALRRGYDAVVDDLRAALQWAESRPDQSSPGYTLAIRLAELSFLRGIPSEAVRRYQQAAAFVADPEDPVEAAKAAAALRDGAYAALGRHAGDDALRLLEASAQAAVRAGAPGDAARDLAKAAEMLCRGAGIFATLPPPERVDELVAQARELAGDQPDAVPQLLTAEAFLLDELDPTALGLTERAIELAREAGDPLVESAALDMRTAIQLASGQMRAAAASSLRRVHLIGSLRVHPSNAMEFSDATAMATECAAAVGDLEGALELARQLHDLPFFREEGHLATARLMMVTSLSGAWDDAVRLSDLFREGWERAGRPRAGNLSRAPYAVATVHGLRGDDAARADWLSVVDALRTPRRPLSEIHFNEFFDGLLWLHRGQVDRALDVMAAAPEDFRSWYNGMWRPWYAALWAEAAVLADRPDAAERIGRARPAVAENPIADAIVDRAEALASGDREGVLGAAAALEGSGCRYQWARSLVLAGGPEKAAGEAALAELGATPTVVPPGRG